MFPTSPWTLVHFAGDFAGERVSFSWSDCPFFQMLVVWSPTGTATEELKKIVANFDPEIREVQFTTTNKQSADRLMAEGMTFPTNQKSERNISDDYSTTSQQHS
jgi:hypothetical protein